MDLTTMLMLIHLVVRRHADSSLVDPPNRKSTMMIGPYLALSSSPSLPCSKQMNALPALPALRYPPSVPQPLAAGPAPDLHPFLPRTQEKGQMSDVESHTQARRSGAD